MMKDWTERLVNSYAVDTDEMNSFVNLLSLHVVAC